MRAKKLRILILCALVAILTGAVIFLLIYAKGDLTGLFRKDPLPSGELLPETEAIPEETEADLAELSELLANAEPITDTSNEYSGEALPDEGTDTPEDPTEAEDTAQTMGFREGDENMTPTVNDPGTTPEPMEDLDLTNVTDLSTEPLFFQTGSIINAKDLPILVTYDTGETKKITGLKDLCFFVETTEKENSDKRDGIKGRKRTITIFESSEFKVPEGETKIELCYKDRTIEAVITGKDLTPPEIRDLKLRSEGSFCKEDLLTIEAEDESPLNYALTEGDAEPVFSDSPKIPVTKNGTYTVIVKDSEGNESRSDLKVANIDQTAPMIENIKIAGE